MRVDVDPLSTGIDGRKPSSVPDSDVLVGGFIGIAVVQGVAAVVGAFELG